MSLGAGEGGLPGRQKSNLYLRPHRIANRFDYITPPPLTYEPLAAEPGGLSPLTILQPSVPTSRAEKERQSCVENYVRTMADLSAPPPPLRPKVSWPQSRAQSPLQLTAAYSRTELLSQKIAAGG